MDDKEIKAKFNVLKEDIESAAKIALDLHQNQLAAILLFNLSILNYNDIGAIVVMHKEIARECKRITEKYMKLG